MMHPCSRRHCTITTSPTEVGNAGIPVVAGQAAAGGGRRRAAGTQGFQASIFTLFATNL